MLQTTWLCMGIRLEATKIKLHTPLRRESKFLLSILKGFNSLYTNIELLLFIKYERVVFFSAQTPIRNGLIIKLKKKKRYDASLIQGAFWSLSNEKFTGFLMEFGLHCTVALGGSRAFWASTQAKAKPALGARGLPRSPLPPQAGFGPSLCALALSIPAAGQINGKIIPFLFGHSHPECPSNLPHIVTQGQIRRIAFLQNLL